MPTPRGVCSIWDADRGLYTSLFADRGYRVTGIDFNAASIEYAAAGNRKGIDYIAGNYVTDFRPGSMM